MTQALSEREDLNLIAEDSDKKTAFPYACLNGHVEIAEYLLKIIRERLGKEEMIKVLNKRDKGGQTSLFLAAWKGHVQVVSFLLSLNETDANISQKLTGMTSLHVACSGGHLEVVKVSFKSGHPIKPSTFRALHLKKRRRYPKEKS